MIPGLGRSEVDYKFSQKDVTGFQEDAGSLLRSGFEMGVGQ